MSFIKPITVNISTSFIWIHHKRTTQNYLAINTTKILKHYDKDNNEIMTYLMIENRIKDMVTKK